jgi:hypothetical protein
MSAFVVQDKTINRFICWMENDNYNNGWTKHRLEELKLTTRETLGKALFNLNCDAVNQRYGDGQAEQFRPLDYRFTYELVTTPHQALKSLECWLYQCSEGNVPETPLFQIMEDYSHRLCASIVHNMEQYERARWD